MKLENSVSDEKQFPFKIISKKVNLCVKRLCNNFQVQFSSIGIQNIKLKHFKFSKCNTNVHLTTLYPRIFETVSGTCIEQIKNINCWENHVVLYSHNRYIYFKVTEFCLIFKFLNEQYCVSYRTSLEE